MHQHQRDTAARNTGFGFVIVHASLRHHHVVALDAMQKETEVCFLLRYPKRTLVKQDTEGHPDYNNQQQQPPQRLHFKSSFIIKALRITVQARAVKAKSPDSNT